MKQSLKLLGLVLAAGLAVIGLIGLASATSDYEWETQTVDSANHYIRGTSLVLDQNGYPHISYFDTSQIIWAMGPPGFSGDLKYAHWNGSAWEIQVVKSGEFKNITYIALDENGFPHICYPGRYHLKYAHWTGSEWEIQTVDSEHQISYYTSMALDSNGYPHMSYSTMDLRYARWTGDNWEIQTVDHGNSYGCDIAIDENDHPHISYSLVAGLENAFVDYDTKYARWTGSTWDIQTVDTENRPSISLQFNYPSIKIDENGHPHICYFYAVGTYDVFPEYTTKYARWTGDTWDIQTVGSGAFSLETLDKGGHPHLFGTYMIDRENYQTKYAHWTGGEWDIKTVDSVNWSSMVLGENDHLHISYSEGDDLKYAILSPKYQPPESLTPLITVVAGIAAIIAMVGIVFALRKRGG